MGVQEFRDVVSSLFVMLNKDTYVLFRIEFLVVLVTVMFFVMFIMDVFRRTIHNTKLAAIFSILDAISDAIVIYLLGAMRAMKFKNQLFPVWGLVLVSFRYNIDFISGYGVHDHHGRRFMEWRNVVKLLGSAFLNLSLNSRVAVPLWLLLALQILRSGYRFYAHSLTVRSVWHGKSSEVVTEHMRAWKPEECDPKSMLGYKYLVYGETQQSIKFEKPRYVMHIDTAQNVQQARRGHRQRQERLTLVTLEKIWGCSNALLCKDNNQENDLQDLCLAFALSRLLRCRLEDVTLPEEIFAINRKLVKAQILKENTSLKDNTDRAFRIMELQLSFVNDYFNTRYPMVFWHGFPSLFSNLLLSTVNFGVVCWLAVDIRKVYKPLKNDQARVVHGFNVDVIITWVFLFFMLFKEIWEMVSYLVSNWTSLLLVCSYAQQKKENKCMERIIPSFFRSRITSKQWHGHIDQYVFLESYDDRPRFWNFLHYITTGMVPKKDDGATLHSAIDVPGCVRLAVLEKLRASLEQLSSPDNPNRTHEEQGQLQPKVITLTSLPEADGKQTKRYDWACYKLPTCSHVILVWHIATSLCEMKIAKDHKVDLSKHGFLSSLLSYFTSFCSSKPYLVDVDDKTKQKLYDKLQQMYVTANSLSRYCAYLLVSKPDLIPDSFYVPNMVLQETVTRARDDILKSCDSLQSRYDKLMEEAGKAIQDFDAVMKSEDVVRLGAKLGKELIDLESQEECWEILSGVWAELLVHIAPTWNAEVHKMCLKSGGEFITHIWALLWHCGIDKSKLWPVEDVYANDAPGTPPPDDTVRNSSVQCAQQTCATGPKEEREEADIERPEMQQIDTEERRTGGAEMLSPDTAGRQNGQGNNVRVRGMRNYGNTCYFNAVLQSLLALDKLRARMLRPNALIGNLGQELRTLFNMTTNTNYARDALAPEKLFSHMCSRNADFRPGMMEDSNNMLGSLLDGLNSDEPTMVESLFRSQVVKHVSSKTCEHTSVSAENLDLSLAIPPKKHASIEDCLDLYSTGVINDWHCMDCSDAAASGNASLNQEDTADYDGQLEQSENKTYEKGESSHQADKQTRTPNVNSGKLPMLDGNSNQMEESNKKQKEEEKIYRAARVKYRISNAAPILTIQLKRFGYSHPENPDKLEEHVSFQDTLDITKFMDPGY
uniref:USP domain-containing protein n=1 Tax=Hordeum vulgare subsp. vulgare TaxID=112509 RepID=A0A8I6WZW6_HORVV